ncbi:MAG: glycine cleavage system protein GcvH [Pseudomonadota bacterium]
MADIHFTEDHEWVRLDGDTVTIGITDYAQSQLGDLVFVELPTVGQTVSKGEDTVVVESVKAASDVYCPVDGDVVEVNQAVVDNPALVNKEPLTGGWLFKVKPLDVGQLADLMDEAAYNAMIA